MLNLQGVTEVKYHPREDYFTVRFESGLVSLESILATVVTAGKRLGREYLPEVIAKP
jgi:hypothetical protein